MIRGPAGFVPPGLLILGPLRVECGPPCFEQTNPNLLKTIGLRMILPSISFFARPRRFLGGSQSWTCGPSFWVASGVWPGGKPDACNQEPFFDFVLHRVTLLHFVQHRTYPIER
jgi:hypothetical protein